MCGVWKGHDVHAFGGYETWRSLGHAWTGVKIKVPTFERMIMRFVRLKSDNLFKLLVQDVAAEFSMKKLDTSRVRFRNFPEALYAVNVTFQQAYRPSGSLADVKLYFSGKHKLYGLKVEVSVLPNGLAVACTNQYPGSVSDFEILQLNQERYKGLLKKNDEELGIQDIGLNVAEYPDQWATIADKGYQGCQDILRAIHPIKRSPRNVLSISDEAFNRRVLSDRIIVENYFGRLSCLWALFVTK